MSTREMLQTLNASHQAFSVFRFPGDEKLNLALGLLDEGHIASSYFVMEPFTQGRSKTRRLGSIYLGLLEEFEFGQLQIIPEKEVRRHNKKHSPNSTYLDYCEQTVNLIRSGKLEKVVLFIEKHCETNKPELAIFSAALDQYPEAFVHWTHVPGEYAWIGASPELLLSREGLKYQSMSLAGTKIYEGDVWTEKEYHEQELVTEFMRKTLKRLGIDSLRESEKYDKVSGHLTHICTDLDFETDIKEEKILHALHPTPAVCGSPREAALHLLKELGMSERSYYCGFIGVKTNTHSKYFVNLRCMEVGHGNATIYVGGGITADSHPQLELEELNAKSQVMRSLLESDD